MVFGARKSKACSRRSKSKKRTAKRSVLFFGEGPTEKAFLDYLHDLYTRRKGNKVIQRGAAKGGSHSDIIYQALVYKMHSSDFDDIYVLIDNDCKEIDCEEATAKAKKKIRKNPLRKQIPVICYYSFPVCVEGFFLNLLDEKIPNNADGCKKIFHNKFLPEKDKLVKSSYAAIFPQSLLQRLRHESALLNSIISVFE